MRGARLRSVRGGLPDRINVRVNVSISFVTNGVFARPLLGTWSARNPIMNAVVAELSDLLGRPPPCGSRFEIAVAELTVGVSGF